MAEVLFLSNRPRFHKIEAVEMCRYLVPSADIALRLRSQSSPVAPASQKASR